MSLHSKVLVSLALLAAAQAQKVGTNKPEVHPTLTWQKCTKSDTPTVTLKLQTLGNPNLTCISMSWDLTICKDPVAWAQNCALEGGRGGGNYTNTYSISANGNLLTMKFVTKSENTNVGSHVYLLKDNSTYELFKLKNQEFTSDVDVSNLPCGLNGMLYFSEMAADGGMSKYPNNKAGAKYRTGYCDAQCPRDIKFINGEANVLNWTRLSNNANLGGGRYGTCCSEMDI
ncbi:unnamed protein product [Rhizoctonia solani]|uniref:Glucanase n=1 Tax=Rhizoctonia solani TaxID=456999 RepID=A0A8H3CTE7_9AGAM|nr:unnamed protein product [Rhizoctonia solani]